LSTDAFGSLAARWKGPEWIREQLISRGHKAHLIYREMMEALLEEAKQPIDFVDHQDRKARAYVAGQTEQLHYTHAGLQHIQEQMYDPVIRSRLDEMWRVLTVEKESEFARLGLVTTGWTGRQSAVMALLEPILARTGFTRTRLKRNPQDAAVRMMRPIGEDCALYCSATITWSNTFEFALPTELYLVRSPSDPVQMWMPMWLLPDLEAYRLSYGDIYNPDREPDAKAVAAVVGIHAFADWAAVLAESFTE
jgi:hypothetical protein